MEQYLTEQKREITQQLTLDGKTYSVGTSWRLPIYTSVFRSEVCANGTDIPSGMNDEACGNYTVSNAEMVLDVSFPDFGVTVPRTTDGQNAPNFTRLMPINFEATALLKTILTSVPCQGNGCRVEFGFAQDQLDYAAQWNDFEQAYVPQQRDVASNLFACDQYGTVHVRAIKQG